MTGLVYQGSELELFAEADQWKRYFASQLRRWVGSRVLEVGAGLGGTTTRLCDGSQQEWLCLEPDVELHAELSRRRSAGLLPACCTTRNGTLEDLAEAAAFDTVLYIDVLEHIEDDAAEFRRAGRLLEPGGCLIVLSPAHPALFSPFDAHVGHFRRYDRASLSSLTAPGLNREAIFHLDSVGYGLSLANRLALRQQLPTKRQIAFWDRVIVPLSRVVDRLTFHRFGRSVVGVWRKAATEPR
ncbi:MAG: class I SAM-dependent methyltransferase [Myxococcota bacterium]